MVRVIRRWRRYDLGAVQLLFVVDTGLGTADL
jgi:hypothetical protein